MGVMAGQLDLQYNNNNINNTNSILATDLSTLTYRQHYLVLKTDKNIGSSNLHG